MRTLITYSTITGNTQKIAEALYAHSPVGTELYPMDKAPDADNYDLLIIGFWVRRGAPDIKTHTFLQSIADKPIACFGTLGAYPDSAHAQLVLERTTELTKSNFLLGTFLCQGKINEKVIHAMTQGKSPHTDSPERRARRAEAAKHPNADDFFAAQQWYKHILRKARDRQGQRLQSVG